MSREVVETVTFASKPHYEVEEAGGHPQQWQPIRSNNGMPKVYETHAEAKEAAHDHGRLYHTDTRIVRVTA